MTQDAQKILIETLNHTIEPFPRGAKKYQSLLDKIGNTHFVLIGEASHGTKEFYQTRAEITEQLIKTKNFMAVAIEGDWPDAYRIHRYLQGQGSRENTKIALEEFKRFPAWMWRNSVIPPFIRSIREFNDSLEANKKIGFYGLDLYSLYSSMQAVIQYLSKIDPEAASHARQRYACFDHFKGDPQTYGYLTSRGIKKSCMKESIEQLIEIQHNALNYIKQDGLNAEEEYYYAMQNARLVKNAENYYRTMYEGRISSWNVRDQHMAETLYSLANHLEKRFRRPAKIVVWAHNSHIGDARATEMGDQGEVNIGQLIREQFEEDTYLIGFSTYQGSVTAASNWDAPAERKTVRPGLVGSYEQLFHQLKHKNFILDLHRNKKLEKYLQIPRLQRAIGVIYSPETERHSHYFFTRLPYQFDSIIHLDKTSAVEPLDRNPEWKRTLIPTE